MSRQSSWRVKRCADSQIGGGVAAVVLRSCASCRLRGVVIDDNPIFVIFEDLPGWLHWTAFNAAILPNCGYCR